MNKNKILSGLLSIIIGSSLCISAIDLLSKPENIPFSFNPMESLDAYFFSFVFLMGNIGWILGGLILISFLSALYFLGTWIYKVISKKDNHHISNF